MEDELRANHLSKRIFIIGINHRKWITNVNWLGFGKGRGSDKIKERDKLELGFGEGGGPKRRKKKRGCMVVTMRETEVERSLII